MYVTPLEGGRWPSCLYAREQGDRALLCQGIVSFNERLLSSRWELLSGEMRIVFLYLAYPAGRKEKYKCLDYISYGHFGSNSQNNRNGEVSTG